jgi:hypothetical protein
MATLYPAIKSPQYSMMIGNEEVTSMVKRFIAGASFEYGLEGPPVAQIKMSSNAFIEDLFVSGMPIKFYLGWDAGNMIEMCNGRIITPPDGTAQDKLDFNITVGDSVLQMGTVQKNKTFKIQKKSAIIHSIVAKYGYIPTIDIDDDTAVDPNEWVMQKGQTDLEFIYQCAYKWNCITWVDSTTSGKKFYFMDSSKCHSKGDTLRKKNIFSIANLFSKPVDEYELAYKVLNKKCNIENIGWKFKKDQGGMLGEPGVYGAGEAGSVARPKDYKIEALGTYWKLKDEVNANLTKAEKAKLAPLVYQAKLSEQQDLLRKYFVPLTHDSKTNLNNSHGPDHDGPIEIEVKLNVGDPFLRPPRSAMLYSGGETKSTELPSFLFKTKKSPQKYNINKVKTEFSSGMISTSLVMTVPK